MKIDVTEGLYKPFEAQTFSQAGPSTVGVGKDPSSWGDFGNWAAGAQAFASGLQGVAGLKMVGQAKEQNRLTGLFGTKNFNQQANAFNERLETRGRSRLNRSSFDSGGQTLAEVMAKYGAKKMDISPFEKNSAPNTQSEPRPALERINQSPTRNIPAARPTYS